GQLTLDQFRVFGEEKNSPLQADFIGAFVDLAIQQRGDHFPILPPGDRLGTEMQEPKPQRTRRFTKELLRGPWCPSWLKSLLMVTVFVVVLFPCRNGHAQPVFFWRQRTCGV